jgi:hypothetical protein
VIAAPEAAPLAESTELLLLTRPEERELLDDPVQGPWKELLDDAAPFRGERDDDGPTVVRRSVPAYQVSRFELIETDGPSISARKRCFGLSSRSRALWNST